jgi:hypothetical protein
MQLLSYKCMPDEHVECASLGNIDMLHQKWPLQRIQLMLNHVNIAVGNNSKDILKLVQHFRITNGYVYRSN